MWFNNLHLILLYKNKKDMPTTVAVHQLEALSHGDSKNEIVLNTSLNVQLHIIAKSDKTVIRLPYGNKFDIIDGCIIIYELAVRQERFDINKQATIIGLSSEMFRGSE